MNTQLLSTIEPKIAPPAREAVGPTPLLNRAQLKNWLGVSEWWVTRFTAREVDPLPWIGTAKIRRISEADVLDWLRRNNGAK